MGNKYQRRAFVASNFFVAAPATPGNSKMLPGIPDSSERTANCADRKNASSAADSTEYLDVDHP